MERTIETVESVETDPSTVAVPLALASRITGLVGHYGFAGDDTAVVPQRVALPPIERKAANAGTGPNSSSSPTQSAG
jgi:hypothetical protein